LCFRSRNFFWKCLDFGKCVQSPPNSN
jgi:hypothetical protein